MRISLVFHLGGTKVVDEGEAGGNRHHCDDNRSQKHQVDVLLLEARDGASRGGEGDARQERAADAVVGRPERPVGAVHESYQRRKATRSLLTSSFDQAGVRFHARCHEFLAPHAAPNDERGREQESEPHR